MRMFRVLLFGCGVILMLASGLLALRSFAGQGINDGEWGNIAKTGVPLCMEQLQWSSWQRNDGSVYPFPAFQAEHRPGTLPEFRIGRAKGFLFDFVFYQGRFTGDGITHDFPAIGPGWGAVYHWRWSRLVFVLGVCCVVAEALIWPLACNKSPGDPGHADS